MGILSGIGKIRRNYGIRKDYKIHKKIIENVTKMANMTPRYREVDYYIKWYQSGKLPKKDLRRGLKWHADYYGPQFEEWVLLELVEKRKKQPKGWIKEIAAGMKDDKFEEEWNRVKKYIESSAHHMKSMYKLVIAMKSLVKGNPMNNKNKLRDLVDKHSDQIEKLENLRDKLGLIDNAYFRKIKTLTLKDKQRYIKKYGI